jgi:hypothetical protein
VRSTAHPLVAALRAQDWVVSAALDDETGILTVHTVTTATGETNLAAVISESGAALLSLNPVGADLESAFLALTEPDLSLGSSRNDHEGYRW